MAFRVFKPRLYSTIHGLNLFAVDAWIMKPKKLVLHDTLHPERLAELYVTLPTRDGSYNKAFKLPSFSSKLDYGHHLVFFHPYTPERCLSPDGTDANFCPPDPFTRRMWAGGTMHFNNSNPLLVGERVTSSSHVYPESVEKKGFSAGKPMLFCNQTIKYYMLGHDAPSLTETRTHVYLPTHSGSVKPRIASKGTGAFDGLRKDFSFTYTPSTTTLFRYSALTFNAHRIHLDKEYAQHSEGYTERLVHGPLTATMLLETAVLSRPNIVIRHFEYRARNPMVVNQKQHFHVHWKDESHAVLWCVDDAGNAGMSGSIQTE